MNSFFFMAFIVLGWMWGWPESLGRWLRDVKAGFEQPDEAAPR